MRIVLASHAFHPAVGGIETMGLLLATEWTRRGHEVLVVTRTPTAADDVFPFRVLRNPRPGELLAALRWCEVLFQNNISLQTLWPLLFVRRPWVIRHATWIRRVDGSLGWQDRIKRFLLRFSTGIANSRATAADLPCPTTVIGNPYRDDLFRLRPEVLRDRDIVFLGRLVSDKGPGLLLQAICKLKAAGLVPSVTFIGAGPELESLDAQAHSLGIGPQIRFVGQKTGDELVVELNRHRIMAVPSIWNEPFGIVALEGIACGCVVVGSAGGGLKDAIGPCGLTFRNGDAGGLAAALEALLRNPDQIRQLTGAAPGHLELHTVRHVADRYLEVIGGACRLRDPARAT